MSVVRRIARVASAFQVSINRADQLFNDETR
ncbi:hypothetical protein BPC006_I0544 [Burkholderia pseudomallei BPC006]|nr:hypothetical protein BPC006_I0544 [Burkholderia pseudomallei BPC006]